MVLYRDINDMKVFVNPLQHPSNSLLPGVVLVVFFQILSDPCNDYLGIYLVYGLLAESLQN
jgi:hypothetical protein